MKTLKLFTFLLITNITIVFAKDWQQITHGPWLLNGDNNKISIGVTTAKNAGVGVDYRLKGSNAPWQRVWASIGGLARLDRSTNIVHLDDLAGGKEYEYKVVLANPELVKEKKVIDQIHSFRTFSKNDLVTEFAFTSDTQTSIPSRDKTYKNFYQNTKEIHNAEFFVHLGDIGNNMTDFKQETLQGNIDMFLKHSPKSVPFYFARGNHDWRGKGAIDFVELLEHPTYRPYFSFMKGKDMFIVLDSGEDRPDHDNLFTNIVDTKQYFKEQRNWLKKLVDSEEFKSARYRIVLIHCGTYAAGEKYMVQRARNLFHDLLNGNEQHNRIHIMLSGHDHVYLRGIPRTNTIITHRNNKKHFNFAKRRGGKDFNYTVVVGEGPHWSNVEMAVGYVKLTPQCLELKMFEENGTLIDNFTITPQGDIKTLIKNPESYESHL